MKILAPLLLLATCCPTLTNSKAILGVDLGSLYMKVALVQRGAPLEIVTNLHSKRKTENMILFDSATRFYGADANSLYGRKPQKTPSSFSVLLGRDEEHPSVTVSITYHINIMLHADSCCMMINVLHNLSRASHLTHTQPLLFLSNTNTTGSRRTSLSHCS